MDDMIPDETLFSLLETYRIQVSQLKESLDSAEFRAQNAENTGEKLLKERDRKAEGLEEKREELKLANEKIDKLQNIIETLKIELQTERQAHTEAREQRSESE